MQLLKRIALIITMTTTTTTIAFNRKSNLSRRTWVCECSKVACIVSYKACNNWLMLQNGPSYCTKDCGRWLLYFAKNDFLFLHSSKIIHKDVSVVLPQRFCWRNGQAGAALRNGQTGCWKILMMKRWGIFPTNFETVYFNEAMAWFKMVSWPRMPYQRPMLVTHG